MANETEFQSVQLLKEREESLLAAWMEAQLASPSLRLDLLSEEELREQSAEFLHALVKAMAGGDLADITAPEYDSVNAMLAGISRSRAVQGFTPSETATFIFSLKDSIPGFLQEAFGDRPQVLNRELVAISQMLDKLGLATFETFVQEREGLIQKQNSVLIEALITPVLRIWEQILVLPLIGAIDTLRAQRLMEDMLEQIVATESTVVILDVTGVPMMDTSLVAHLIRAVQAAKMLGARVILTGISPLNAQTLVNLGGDTSQIVAKRTLWTGLAEAFGMVGVTLVRGEE